MPSNKNDLLIGTLIEHKAEHENNKLLQEQNSEIQDKLYELWYWQSSLKNIESYKKLQEKHNAKIEQYQVKYGELLEKMAKPKTTKKTKKAETEEPK